MALYADVFEAVQNRNLTAVKHFIETDGIQPIIKNKDGDTLAHVAIRNVDANILDYLVKKEPKLLSSRGMHDITLLEQAIHINSMTLVKHLAENLGANVCTNGDLNNPISAVHFATESCHLPVLKYFIEERKVDPNFKDAGGLPLIFVAARTPCREVIDYLIDTWKVDIFALDLRGRNIFSQSAARCDLTIPKYFLDEKKYPIDTKNPYILQDVFLMPENKARENMLDFIKYFVEEKGSPVNTDAPTSLLHHASDTGLLEIVKYLVEQGADVKKKNLADKTPLEVAKKDDVVQYLKEVEGQQRERRSLPIQWRDSVETLGEPVWVRKTLIEGGSSLSLDHPSRGAARSFQGSRGPLGPQHVDNFLILAAVFSRSRFGLPSRSSSKDMMEDRVDPVAIDSVHNNFF